MKEMDQGRYIYMCVCVVVFVIKVRRDITHSSTAVYSLNGIWACLDIVSTACPSGPGWPIWPYDLDDQLCWHKHKWWLRKPWEEDLVSPSPFKECLSCLKCVLWLWIVSVEDSELIALNILRHFSITHSSRNPNVPFSAENVHRPLSINVEAIHVSETVHEPGLCKSLN